MYADSLFGWLGLGRWKCSFSLLVLFFEIDLKDCGLFVFFDGGTEVDGGDGSHPIVLECNHFLYAFGDILEAATPFELNTTGTVFILFCSGAIGDKIPFLILH